MNSKIEIEILAHKNIDHKNWYLCKGNLLDYLLNLKTDFYDFAIQRRIVKNQYLDSLYQTIKSGDPIPVLTLTFSGSKLPSDTGTTELDMDGIEILDGLQRTFRMWAYNVLSDKYSGQKDKDIIPFVRQLKEEKPVLFESGVITTSLIKKMIASGEILNVRQAFKSFGIYFIVWAGLDEKEVVQKMLVLNAGQKAVSKTHQFELLFLHFFNDIRTKHNKIELFREKDESAANIKNGKRHAGQFMFSSFIVGLQSFAEQKPLRVSTEEPPGLDNEEDSDSTLYNLIFNPKFLAVFISLLVQLDKQIYQKEENAGLEWFVKETTLSGVLAALGASIDFEKIDSADAMITEAEQAFKKLGAIIEEKGFNINVYRVEFANISSRAINFGTFIRKAIMEYTTALLQDQNPDWHELFIKTQKIG